MKRVLFLVLVLAVAWMPRPADAQQRTVQVQNDTTLCYTVDVKGYGSDGALLYIGHHRIDSKKQQTFAYTYAAKGPLSLLVSADACFHGPMPGAAHAKDARANEVFQIVQPGQSVYIVRKP